MLRLHYNKSNGIYSARNDSRSIQFATPKRYSRPRFGATFELSPNVHAIATKSLFVESETGSRPLVPVVVTKWPKVRLLIAVVKERLQ